MSFLNMIFDYEYEFWSLLQGIYNYTKMASFSCYEFITFTTIAEYVRVVTSH